MTNPGRLLLVHAHPDDESSQSSATMARYAQEGAQVTLVTCTLGERGEILVDDWAHYTPAELGEKRTEEVATALGILGVSDHVWLGGRGRYHDTGMGRDEQGNVLPPDDLPEGAFWTADLREASDFLVEVIRSRRPHVLTTYDPNGNYGHPDHIQAHRVAMYAQLLAGAPTYRPDLGEPWQVQRTLWLTPNPTVWQEAWKRAQAEGINPFGEQPAEATAPDHDADRAEAADHEPAERPGPPGFSVDASQIAAVIPYGQHLQRATDALLAHRSQVRATDQFWRFFDIMRQVEGSGEAYVYVSGVAFPESDAPADDLFVGLDTTS